MSEGPNYEAVVKAREILSKYKIDINSPTNGVRLPNVLGYTKYTDPDWDGVIYVATHNGRHTNNYFITVYERLAIVVKDNAGESDEVIRELLEEELHDIRTKLLSSDIILHRERLILIKIGTSFDLIY